MHTLLLKIMSAVASERHLLFMWCSYKARRIRNCTLHAKASQIILRKGLQSSGFLRLLVPFSQVYNSCMSRSAVFSLPGQVSCVEQAKLDPMSNKHFCIPSQFQMAWGLSPFEGPSVYGSLHLHMFKSVLFVAWSEIVVGVLGSANDVCKGLFSSGICKMQQ